MISLQEKKNETKGDYLAAFLFALNFICKLYGYGLKPYENKIVVEILHNGEKVAMTASFPEAAQQLEGGNT